ncbi:MAG: RsmB/NOP family class I SAM-dependent RNA methyltransferase [Phycisphaerae bacterium]
MSTADEAAPRATPSSGRQAAYAIVARVLAARTHAADELAELRSTGALPPREAALAMELALGVLRHTVTLGHVLGSLAKFDEHRSPAALRAILWVGAYQLIWMDRIPAYAAVDDAVSAARARVGAGAGRLVNAVLRNVGRAIAAQRVAWQRGDARQVRVSWADACAFDRAVLPAVCDAETPARARRAAHSAECGAAASERSEPGWRHLAAATASRPARYRELVERFGFEAAEQIAWASQAPPATVLQRHALRIDEHAFEQRVRDEFGEAAEFAEGAAFLPAGVGGGRSTLLADGVAYVQDATARAAANLLAPQPGERVLDLCAAPGGKSVTLALAMHDRGEIVAADASADRLARLAQMIARLGLRCVTPRQISPDNAIVEWASGDAAQSGDERLSVDADSARGSSPERTPTSSGSARRAPPRDAGPDDAARSGDVRPPGFDAVLVDAPCTNTGVLARRPEARLTFSRQKLEALAAIQRRLLRQAAAQVRPGGRLVYSTCSLEPEENAEQIVTFLGDHADWRMGREQLTLPRWGPSAADWCDGGYAALLRRG